MGSGSAIFDSLVAFLVGAAIAGSIGAAVAAARTRSRWRRPTEVLRAGVADLATSRADRAPAVASAAPLEVRQLAEQIDALWAVSETRVAQLTERASSLRTLVDALPDPILVSDAGDRVVMINAPAERLLQLPPQQVTGKPVVAAVNDLAILELFEQCRRRMGDGADATVDREIRLLRRGARLTFQAHAERTPRGGMLIVLRDVSTLAATLQMKTDFVANASHELRTPISAIKAAFETLRDADGDELVGGRCLSIIDGQLGRLEEMLRDLLDLSRAESPDLKPEWADVSVEELVANLRAIWLPAAEKRWIALSLPAPAAGCSIVSDRRLLDWILKNLIENALKFTPAGGRVDVAIDCESEQTRIAVRDTGCGIPPESIERVFERFYQVNAARSAAAGRGTGLGLAIVKHAVGALGGQVKIESRVGEGTLIECRLPVRAASPA